MKLKTALNSILYWLLFGLWWLASLLPMWLHYVFADVLYVLVAHGLRYRHKVIDKNLAHAFPELTDAERRRLRRQFYHYFCDFIAEIVKYATMRPANIKRRMVFHGAEQVREILRDGQDVALMLGHYCNWEWMTCYPIWLEGVDKACGQIVHELENPVVNRVMRAVRNRMGSQTVAMQETLRWLLGHRKEGQTTILAYVSDQVPLWWNIHHWLNFMNQDTPVFTGLERIARKLNQAVVYIDARRVRRGYYEADVQVITRDPNSLPEFGITDEYFRRLEATIRRDPQYWLWSHNRWKRPREEFNRDYEVKDGRVVKRVNNGN